MSKVHTWIFHILFAIFGTGSWLAINGIFSELSFLVQTAPESWNLASGLTLTIQLGNIIPFVYVIVGQFTKLRHENVVIYLILVVGCVSSVLLAFLWHETKEFWGESHSLYLYMFTFTLAAVDCTSSVTYFPFMANFPEKFIVSLMIGEGLSGLIPSVLALAQNGGTVKMMSSSPSTSTDAFGNSTPPADNGTYCYTNSNFSEKTYFLLIFVLFFISGIAFFLINMLPVPGAEKLKVAKRSYSVTGSNRSTNSSENGSENISDREHEQSRTLLNRDSKNSSHVIEFLETVQRPMEFNSNNDDDNLNVPTASSSVSFLHSITGVQLTLSDVIHFIGLFSVCFLFNGALPSISTYILLPYGNEEMLVISNIGNIVNPLTCIIMMFLPITTSLNVGSFSTVLTVILSTILIAFAVLTPPMTDQLTGTIITASLWVVFKIVATIARVVQANACKSRSKQHLFFYGVVTQAGSFCGAVIFFCLCNYTNVFVPVYPDC